MEHFSNSSMMAPPSPPGDADLFEMAFAALRDMWTEALVVAISLHVYFRAARGGAGFLARRFGAGGAGGGGPGGILKGKLEAEHHSEHDARSFLASSAGEEAFPADATDSDNSADVRRLVAGLLRRSPTESHDVLEQYEELVRGRRVDLRQHINNRENAISLYNALIECSIKNANQTAKPAIMKFLTDMQAFSFGRSRDFYADILKHLVHGKFFQDALWLYDVLTADGVTPDRPMYVGLMGAAMSCGQDQKAINFFKDVCKQGPPSMRTYMTILRVYSKRQDWRGAVELLDGLSCSGTVPDALVLNTVLGLVVSASRIDVAEKVFAKWQKIADVVSCNILLKGFTQIANTVKAERLLEHMLKQGPAPNIITFNTIMDCTVRALQDSHPPSSAALPRSEEALPRAPAASSYSKSTRAQRAWQLLDQLISLGLKPDRYTCSTIVKGMHIAGCTTNDIDMAVALVRRIGVEGLSSSGEQPGDVSNGRLLEVLFNTLLDACVSIRDLDRMAEIFKMMESCKVEPTSVTFGTLIKAFGQAGRLENCHEVWKNMLNAGIAPTIITYGCYIDACIRNADISMAEDIFASMLSAGVKPNAVVYTSLIRGCAHARQPLKALELYKEMRDRGIAATTVTFNSVLDIIARQLADPAKLEEVMDDMREADIAPDVVTYSILIKASCNAGQIASALTLFRRLRSHGLHFDEVAFNTLLLACSKAEKVADAEEIFNEMLEQRMTPTHVTISILVKMYGKAKMLNEAIKLVTLVSEKYGLKPNLYVYTCLIQACVRNRQVRRSWDVFSSMLAGGVMPDAITYGTVIYGCIYHSKFDVAMTLVRHAYGIPTASPKDMQAGGGADAESFLSLLRAPQNDRPVALQGDVLRALSTALRRKELTEALAELDEIVASGSRAGGGKPSSAKGSWSSAAPSPASAASASPASTASPASSATPWSNTSAASGGGGQGGRRRGSFGLSAA